MASTAALCPLDVTTWIGFGSFTIRPDKRNRTLRRFVETWRDAALRAFVALSLQFCKSSDKPSSSFQISFPSNVASSRSHSFAALFSAFSTSFSRGRNRSSCSSICSVNVWSSRCKEFIFDVRRYGSNSRNARSVVGRAAASVALLRSWASFAAVSLVAAGRWGVLSRISGAASLTLAPMVCASVRCVPYFDVKSKRALPPVLANDWGGP